MWHCYEVMMRDFINYCHNVTKAIKACREKAKKNITHSNT